MGFLRDLIPNTVYTVSFPLLGMIEGVLTSKWFGFILSNSCIDEGSK